jgi:hypothetical protein
MGSWWTVTEFSGIGAPLVKIWDSMLIHKLRAHPRAVLEVDGSSVTHERDFLIFFTHQLLTYFNSHTADLGKHTTSRLGG